MSLRIEHHAPGHFTIAGYQAESRFNEKGQIVVCPAVCEVVFAEPGKGNGITKAILLEVIRRHESEQEANTPETYEDSPPKNKGGRPRKNPEPETSETAA